MLEDMLLVISRNNVGDHHPIVYGPCTLADAKKIAIRELAKWNTVSYQWLTDTKIGLGERP